jgi:hypothetical protein
MIRCNVVHLPTSWSSQWSLSFWLSHQYRMYIHLLAHSCYMSCPFHPPWLQHFNYTWGKVQVMKLLIMQFSSTSCHFISLRSKYSPQQPVLKHPHSLCSSLNVRDQVSHPQRTTGNLRFKKVKFLELWNLDAYWPIKCITFWRSRSSQRLKYLMRNIPSIMWHCFSHLNIPGTNLDPEIGFHVWEFSCSSQSLQENGGKVPQLRPPSLPTHPFKFIIQ